MCMHTGLIFASGNTLRCEFEHSCTEIRREQRARGGGEERASERERDRERERTGREAYLDMFGKVAINVYRDEHPNHLPPYEARAYITSSKLRYTRKRRHTCILYICI